MTSVMVKVKFVEASATFCHSHMCPYAGISCSILNIKVGYAPLPRLRPWLEVWGSSEHGQLGIGSLPTEDGLGSPETGATRMDSTKLTLVTRVATAFLPVGA